MFNNLDGKEDRLYKHLKKYIDDFLFVEFSKEIFKDTLVPVSKNDMDKLEYGEMSISDVFFNMVDVIGADVHFQYNASYINIMNRIYDDLPYVLINQGNEYAKDGDFERAVIFFRASILIDETLDGLYSYGKALRELYVDADDFEKIGDLKAESIEVFEKISIDYPDFSKAYYFMGYDYLNMGLYIKSRLAFKKFIDMEKEGDLFEDAKKRIEDLEDPCIMEEGINHISSLRFEEGINILKKYEDSKYNQWWPLYYNLGYGYEALGFVEEAIKSYTKVLRLNGSHLDSMEGLVRLYTKLDDMEKVEKYMNKITIVKDSNLN